MMLHRHFADEKSSDEMTKLEDMRNDKGREFVSDIFPPIEEATEEEKPKRKRKTADK